MPVPDKSISREVGEFYLSRKRAAEFLTVCQRQLDYLLQRGELPAFKLGKKTIFRKDDLMRFAERTPVVRN